jgi:signal transduction histidine kinase
VVLRVRDTGSRLNDDELAAALQPFRTPSDRTEAAGVSLSLTKALVEANRATFHIKSAPQSGTLIEVVFAHMPAAV